MMSSVAVRREMRCRKDCCAVVSYCCASCFARHDAGVLTEGRGKCRCRAMADMGCCRLRPRVFFLIPET